MSRTLLSKARHAGHVQRWHTVPTIRPQNVAAHSWGVALLVMRFWPHRTNGDLLRATLLHDAHEGVLGDVPATAKWRWPHLKAALYQCESELDDRMFEKLTISELKVLKFCDLLELCEYAAEEVHMGNKGMIPVFKRGWVLCAGELKDMPTYHPSLINFLVELREKACGSTR